MTTLPNIVLIHGAWANGAWIDVEHDDDGSMTVCRPLASVREQHLVLRPLGPITAHNIEVLVPPVAATQCGVLSASLPLKPQD